MNTQRFLALVTLLTATSALAGTADTSADLNRDGTIDGADLELMRSLFFGADARADLNRDGRVDFADLALFKSAGAAPRTLAVPPPAPSVFLQPESQSVDIGDPVAVDLYWDFTGEAALGGGTDFAWDASAFSLVSIVFDDNFGTGPGQFDPAFTRCDNEVCYGPGFIDGLATGNFNGLGDPGPIYVATITFTALREGVFPITLTEDAGIAGPFISAITFTPYADIVFAGAEVDIGGGPPAPRINVQPPQVNFPNTIVGATASAQVRVDSVGDLPLTIGSLVPPDSPFALSADACSGQVLAPDESCELTVDFSPTAPGRDTSRVTIPSDDPGRPQVNVPLAGTGIPAPDPDISVRSMVLFPAIRVGQTDDASVLVQNIGTEALLIGEVGVANALEAPFTIESDGCSNRTIPPSAGCRIDLRFAPTAVGLATGDFDIPSNDPDTPSLIVQVRGTGEPGVGLSTNGVQGDAGRCFNRATRQNVTAPLGGHPTLPCEGIGLTATAGDGVLLFLRGTAESASAVGGHGLGVTVERVRCANATTGQSVNIDPPGPGVNWNCVARGLTVTPGDVISMTVFGHAL